MTAIVKRDAPKSSSSSDHINRASADFQFQKSSIHLEVQMTPAGLLAVGALVAGILLSVAPIVKAATRHLSRPK